MELPSWVALPTSAFSASMRFVAMFCTVTGLANLGYSGYFSWKYGCRLLEAAISTMSFSVKSPMRGVPFNASNRVLVTPMYVTLNSVVRCSSIHLRICIRYCLPRCT